MKSENANADLRAQSVSPISNLYHPLLHQKEVNLLCTLIKKLPHVEKLGERLGSRGSILLTYTCTFSLAVFPQVGGGLCGMPIM